MFGFVICYSYADDKQNDTLTMRHEEDYFVVNTKFTVL